MKLSLRTSSLALAVAGALAMGSASASVRLSNDFDGNWFNPAEAGRGVAVDYLPLATGGGVLSLGYYAYDAQGRATWVLLAAPMSEFQFGATDVAVNAFAGGSFGTFTAGGPATQVGTANITVNSCNSMSVTFNMTPASGLTGTTLNLQPFFENTDCAFTKTFTACPSFATAAPAFGSRACQLSGNLLGGDFKLTNDITWVLEGKVGVGGDNAMQSTLRIEPGTLIVGTGDTFDHLAINRGSKIFAEGTPTAPIILTSPFELPGFTGAPNPKDIGGFVISGNAPANCNPNCVAEWDPTNRYGGTNAADSSGIVRYMQVRYAGYIFTTNRELNSFTFNAVGSGTTLEYLQSYRGGDDGMEFFGGTANVSHFVDSCGGDDSIDWDEGFSGKMQFALSNQRGCDGQDHGFEVSNSPTNFDATPRSRPTIANVTLRGGGTGSRDAFNIKDGTGGNWFNIVATGYNRTCVRFEGATTQTAAGPTTALTGTTTLQNTIIDCPTNFSDGTGVTAGYSAAWFGAQAGNEARTLGLTGFLPSATSNVTGKNFVPTSDWFVATDYAGAFRSNDPKDNWTNGWTYRINE